MTTEITAAQAEDIESQKVPSPPQVDTYDLPGQSQSPDPSSLRTPVANRGTTRVCGVFWDIENMQIPRGADVVRMGQRLLSFAQQYGEVTRCVAVTGSFALNSVARDRLSQVGIDVVHSPVDKEAADKALIVAVLLWLWDCSRGNGNDATPPCVIVCTADHDFSALIHKIKMRQIYTVLITRTKIVRQSLLGAAHETVDFSTTLGLQDDHGGGAAAAAAAAAASPAKRTAGGGASIDTPTQTVGATANSEAPAQHLFLTPVKGAKDSDGGHAAGKRTTPSTVGSHDGRAARMCWHGDKCKRVRCKFVHPKDLIGSGREQSMSNDESKDESKTKGDESESVSAVVLPGAVPEADTRPAGAGSTTQPLRPRQQLYQELARLFQLAGRWEQIPTSAQPAGLLPDESVSLSLTPPPAPTAGSTWLLLLTPSTLPQLYREHCGADLYAAVQRQRGYGGSRRGGRRRNGWLEGFLQSVPFVVFVNDGTQRRCVAYNGHFGVGANGTKDKRSSDSLQLLQKNSTPMPAASTTGAARLAVEEKSEKSKHCCIL